MNLMLVYLVPVGVLGHVAEFACAIVKAINK